jgi:hypothetical protein
MALPPTKINDFLSLRPTLRNLEIYLQSGKAVSHITAPAHEGEVFIIRSDESKTKITVRKITGSKTENIPGTTGPTGVSMDLEIEDGGVIRPVVIRG